MASATSDTIIFMFLGMVLVSDKHIWHTGFVLWSLALCFVFRFIGVFLLTGIMNRYRVKKINLEEQFIAAYGGLRGAVAFSLVNMLEERYTPNKEIFITTTLVVILFTIFIQGITIKPLVNFLHIQRRRSDRKNLSEEINDTAMDHIMAGIEEILGQHGDFYLRALMIYYNDQYLNKWFVRPTCESKLTRLFEKIAISEHYAHLYGPVALIEDKVKPLYTADNIVKRVRSSSISHSLKDEVLLDPGLILGAEHDDDTGLKQDGVQLRSAKKKRTKSMMPVRYNSHRVGASDRAFSEDEEDEHRVYVGDDPGATKKKSSEAAQALRRALRDNPYNKLHYKYNRNLVGEEDQEMSAHLHRRSLNARRMTRLASSVHITSSSDASQAARPKTQGTADFGDGVIELMERHNRRRSTMALRRRNHPALQTYFSSPEPGSPPESSGILQSLQEASEPNSLPDVRPMSTPSELEVTSEGGESMFLPVTPKFDANKAKKLALSRNSSPEPEEEELSLMSYTGETSALPDDDDKSKDKV